MRTELNIETGEVAHINTTAYITNGATALIDEGQPVPAGAVLASSVPAAPAVPQAVTMKQAQLALLAAGKLDAVDGLIAAQARARGLGHVAHGRAQQSPCGVHRHVIRLDRCADRRAF